MAPNTSTNKTFQFANFPLWLFLRVPVPKGNTINSAYRVCCASYRRRGMEKLPHIGENKVLKSVNHSVLPPEYHHTPPSILEGTSSSARCAWCELDKLWEYVLVKVEVMYGSTPNRFK